MKKVLGLIIGLGVVAGLAYYAYTLNQTEGKSDTTELIDFEIKEVEKIDKIEIYDPFFNKSYTLVKKNEVWVDKDGNCVQQYPVETILNTFRKVTFKGYVVDALKPNVTKMMAAKAKKVTVYKDGDLDKVWYVGHSTPDHQGTYMLVETADIKSDQPVIMSMKGLNGILEPRFFVDPRQWACTDLFDIKQKEIKKVSVVNSIDTNDSYEITRTENGFFATQNGVPLENVNTANLTFFMNGFENIHFNQKNYTMSEMQIDSMKNVNPYIKLNIDKLDGSTYKLNLYKEVDKNSITQDDNGFSLDVAWGFTNEGELVKIQYFVIGPIIDGKDFFIDKTELN